MAYELANAAMCQEGGKPQFHGDISSYIWDPPGSHPMYLFI